MAPMVITCCVLNNWRYLNNYTIETQCREYDKDNKWAILLVPRKFTSRSVKEKNGSFVIKNSTTTLRNYTESANGIMNKIKSLGLGKSVLWMIH